MLLQAFLFELFPELHHFEKLESEERKQAEDKQSHNFGTESSEEEGAERDKVDREKREDAAGQRPNIPVSRLHNSTSLWLRT